ncbi:MAG: hypothetical protein NT175_03380 [Bacteroidetes bacterium]|nr:hypothetical protein [Bacteroidota bacterium]
MRKLALLFSLASLISLTLAQNQTIKLTFTGVNNTTYVQLDSIKVMNRTQGGDTVLYWPDTVLVLNYVGINENPVMFNGFRMMQNYPNPALDQTTISIYVPERDNVNLRITDILGRQLLTTERLLDKGYHSFRFLPGNEELYFFTASWRGVNQYIKILSTVTGSERDCKLEYSGSLGTTSVPLKSIAADRDFTFTPGDELLYIGYIDTLESGRIDKPETSQTYTFQFAINIPCPGIPTVEYEGQVYNTIQIFSQCWLKENLNVGTIIPGSQEMTSNGIIEKYCYNNQEDSCEVYGGLYLWKESMQYSFDEGAQGICPTGWHLPTDDAWKILEGNVDSYYEVGDPVWDGWMDRGFDVGQNLKSQNGWDDNGNGTDLYGFTALPGGIRWPTTGSFDHLGISCNFWSSTPPGVSALFRYLSYSKSTVFRYDIGWSNGLSVRCLKDD